MNAEENSYIREWIKKGEDDLSVADLIMTYKPLVLDVALPLPAGSRKISKSLSDL